MKLSSRNTVQLHTLRNETERDFPGVLRQLKEMGWSGVEFAGLKGVPVENLAAVMEKTGLKTAGSILPLYR